MTQESLDITTSNDGSTTYRTTSIDENDDLDADQSNEVPRDEESGLDTATVRCQLKDFACEPIEGLKYKLVVDGETVKGKTDAQGNLETLSDLAPGCYVDVFVLREYTKDYKKVGSLYAYPGETDYSIVSPKIRFEAETEPHVGAPGNADADKPPVPEKIPPSTTTKAQTNAAAGNIKPSGPDAAPTQTKSQNSTTQPSVSAPPPNKSEVKSERDATGNPQATVQDKNKDWLKRVILVAFNIWTWGAFQNKTTTNDNSSKNNDSQTKGSNTKDAKSKKAQVKAPPTEKAAATAHPLVNPALPASAAATGVPLSAGELASLQKLIKIAEEQVEINYSNYKPGGLTTSLLKIFAKGEAPNSPPKSANNFLGYCLAYVKVALNRAKYITGNSGTELAKDSVKDWTSTKLNYKFKDVSQELPQVEITYEDVYAPEDFPAALEEKKQRTTLEKLKKLREKQKKPMSDAEYQAEKSKIKTVPIRTIKHIQPDLMYTLPGDIIVYDQVAPPRLDVPGHIDIRTYHGFMSDAAQPRTIPPLGAGSNNRYKVIGVYRKISDTMAMARVQAFLRIVQEFETAGYSENESYFVLPDGKDTATGKAVRRKFTNASTHPYSADAPVKYESKDYNGNKNTAAGAYQIKLATWEESIESVGWPLNFTPEMQQRIAIYRLQFRNNRGTHPRRTALGFIMQGDVEKAVNETHLWDEWSWLPGGPHKEKITIDALKAKFVAYVEKKYK